MPQIRDLTVCVTDVAGRNLQEWGVQHLRSQNKVSAYIQSSTDMGFRITIQPNLPIQDPRFSPAHPLVSDTVVKDERRIPAMDGNSPGTLGSFLKYGDQVTSGLSTQSDDGYIDRYYPRRWPRPSHQTLSPPIRPQVRSLDITPPPYHFLASLFLDGRQKAERRIVVYLDPKDEDFSPPNGKVKFKSRWVQGSDGAMREHSWVFKDVGIETVFDKMLINGERNSAGELAEQDEDTMIAAMNATELGAGGNSQKDEKSGIGQILVVIQRVILGNKWIEPNYRSKHQEGEAEDVDMDGIKNEITHSAGLTHTATLPLKPIRVVNYWPYKEGEEPFATFQFFYRSRETLEKFSFPSFPRLNNRTIKPVRFMEDRFSNVTPLSIARPIPSSKRKFRSFEENIKAGTWDKSDPKYKFSEGHRELAVVKIHPPSLAKRRQSRSAASTLHSTKSTLTNSTLRHTKELQSSQTSEEQDFDSDEVNANRPSHSTLSKVSIPKSTTSIFMSSSCGALAFAKNNSSSSIPSNLSNGSDPTRTQGSSPTLSSDLDGIHKKALAELNKFCKEKYRKYGQASDADDEREDSDAETLLGAKKDEMDDEISFLDKENLTPNPNQDDQGLHMELRDMLCIRNKKRRISLPTSDEHSEEGSSAVSLDKGKKIKLNSPKSSPAPAVTTAIALGVLQDSKEEDSAVNPTA